MRPIDALRVVGAEGTDRATVALVYEAVKAGQALTERGFVDVQRQLDQLQSLPTTVGSLHQRVTMTEARMTKAERALATAPTEHERLTVLAGRVERVEADAAESAAEVKRAARDREAEVKKAAEERAEEAAELAKAERSYRKIHLPAIGLGFLGFVLAVTNRIWGTG